MTIQDVLFAATVAAFLSTTGFVVVYWVRARHTWWRDPLGRMLMLGGVAVALLSGVGTVRRVNTHYGLSMETWLTVGSIVAYLAVAATWLYKSRVVVKETRRHEPPARHRDQ